VYQELELVLMPGGTSKGLFVQDRDVPSVAAERDAFILARGGEPLRDSYAAERRPLASRNSVTSTRNFRGVILGYSGSSAWRDERVTADPGELVGAVAGLGTGHD
jgi:hypothetical protein